jgi:hypothetical protein
MNQNLNNPILLRSILAVCKVSIYALSAYIAVFEDYPSGEKENNKIK